MTKKERWGGVIAGGVLVAVGLARRSLFGIGIAGAGVALIRFATRRMKERTEGALERNPPEGTLDEPDSKVEVPDDIQPRHEN